VTTAPKKLEGCADGTGSCGKQGYSPTASLQKPADPPKSEAWQKAIGFLKEMRARDAAQKNPEPGISRAPGAAPKSMDPPRAEAGQKPAPSQNEMKVKDEARKYVEHLPY